VGAELARDLARSGSKSGTAFFRLKCTSRYTTASQLIASKLGSHKMIPVILAIVENKSAHLPNRDIKPL
jgi:hypothetical protein